MVKMDDAIALSASIASLRNIPNFAFVNQPRLQQSTTPIGRIRVHLFGASCFSSLTRPKQHVIYVSRSPNGLSSSMRPLLVSAISYVPLGSSPTSTGRRSRR